MQRVSGTGCMCHPWLIRFEHVYDRFAVLRRQVETSERRERDFLSFCFSIMYVRKIWNIKNKEIFLFLFNNYMFVTRNFRQDCEIENHFTKFIFKYFVRSIINSLNFLMVRYQKHIIPSYSLLRICHGYYSITLLHAILFDLYIILAIFQDSSSFYFFFHSVSYRGSTISEKVYSAITVVASMTVVVMRTT